MRSRIKHLLKRILSLRAIKNKLTANYKIRKIRLDRMPYHRLNDDIKIYILMPRKISMSAFKRYAVYLKKHGVYGLCFDKKNSFFNNEILQKELELEFILLAEINPADCCMTDLSFQNYDNQKSCIIRATKKVSKKNMNKISAFILSHRKNKKVIIVGHSGGLGGAEVLLENIIKELKKQQVDPVVLVRGNGPMIEKYNAIAPTYVINTDESTTNAFDRLKKLGYNEVIFNTVINGDLVSKLKSKGFYVTSLIHELPGVIKLLKCERRAKSIAKHD
jgi:hypothetical protein